MIKIEITKRERIKMTHRLQMMDLSPWILTILFIRVETLLADPPKLMAAEFEMEFKLGASAADATLNGSAGRFVFDTLRFGGGGGLLVRPWDRCSGGPVRGACCKMAEIQLKVLWKWFTYVMCVCIWSIVYLFFSHSRRFDFDRRPWRRHCWPINCRCRSQANRIDCILWLKCGRYATYGTKLLWKCRTSNRNWRRSGNVIEINETNKTEEWKNNSKLVFLKQNSLTFG